ncbi:MAG: hypothetical protein ACREKI_08535 [Gemmatimonadota bacterium]
MRRIALWAGGVLLAVVSAVLWWWREVPGFAGPETFFEMKGRIAAVETQPADSSDEERGYDVVIRSSEGWSVRGYLRVPATPPGTTRPGAIVLGGLGTGRRAAHLVRAEEPYVVLGLDYPWAGSRRPSLGEIVRKLPEIRHSVLRTPAALLLAADLLDGRADVRGEELVLIGASFGVPFAATAGALDPRFQTVLLLYGGGDSRNLILHNLERRYPAAPAWFADAAAALIAPVEPICYVSAIAPRRVVMVNGRRDERIPAESVRLLYDAAREPKTLVWLDAAHIHPRNDSLLQAIADTAVRVLEAPQARGAPAERPPGPGGGAVEPADPDTIAARVCPKELRPRRPVAMVDEG